MQYSPINSTQIFNWPFLAPIIALVVIWSLIWKGLALWRAGRNNQLGWFVVLLVVNTLGILEILYLLIFSKRKNIQ